MEFVLLFRALLTCLLCFGVRVARTFWSFAWVIFSLFAGDSVSRREIFVWIPSFPRSLQRIGPILIFNATPPIAINPGWKSFFPLLWELFVVFWSRDSSMGIHCWHLFFHSIWWRECEMRGENKLKLTFVDTSSASKLTSWSKLENLKILWHVSTHLGWNLNTESYLMFTNSLDNISFRSNLCKLCKQKNTFASSVSTRTIAKLSQCCWWI